MLDSTTISISEKPDIERIRKDFPILDQKIFGQPLVYLDNAATTQKPLLVLDTLENYYREYNSNVHRGVHHLSQVATESYEAARKRVCEFINAKSSSEVIFTRGTTEGINLVAATWGRQNIKEGDEIIVSGMEHHSNIVPWQILCLEKKAKLKAIPVNDNGELIMSEFEKLITPKTKFISIVHASNSLGTINPVKEVIEIAHQHNIPVLVDGAQSSVHLDIDVQDMDCDFFAFSGHKVYGPTGAGVLYGKKKILEEMPVFMGGGEMIKEVTFEKTTYANLPYKYEAGTPNIADTIALKVALDFITETGKQLIRNHENNLLKYATEQMNLIDGLRIIGTATNKVSLISFVIKNIHPQDIGVLLDNQGIAVRTGHHCTEPLMKRFGIPGTVRASFALYNTKEEVDRLISALKKAIKMLA